MGNIIPSWTIIVILWVKNHLLLTGRDLETRGKLFIMHRKLEIGFTRMSVFISNNSKKEKAWKISQAHFRKCEYQVLSVRKRYCESSPMESCIIPLIDENWSVVGHPHLWMSTNLVTFGLADVQVDFFMIQCADYPLISNSIMDPLSKRVPIS